MFKITFQDNLLVSLHAVVRGNHRMKINEGFHWYLNKVQDKYSADMDSLHQWLQGVFYTLYAWNAGPVDGTNIS